MTKTRLLTIVALCVALAGCDQNAFTDDFPDLGTAGMPPYVSFDHTQLGAPTWQYVDAEQGTVRAALPFPAAAPAVATSPATAVPFLRVRLPRGLEEDVTVTYTVGGNAEYGVDYRLFVLNQVAGTDGAMTWQWVETPPTGNQGSLTIQYFLVNPTLPAGSAGAVTGFSRDIRIQPLANLNATTPRTMQLTITGATAQSGREISVGRLPGMRDSRVTLSFTPNQVTATITCPTTATVGQEVAFTSAINAAAARPLAFTWNFGDGTTATTQNANHTFLVPGTYQVSFQVVGPLNTVSRTCSVVVSVPGT